MAKLLIRFTYFAALALCLSLASARADCDPRDRNCDQSSGSGSARTKANSFRNSSPEGVGSHRKKRKGRSGRFVGESGPGHSGNAGSGRSTYRNGTGGGGGAAGGNVGYGPRSAPTMGRPSPSIGERGDSASHRPLQPVRAYLRAQEIPPSDAGAYGLLVLHSKPTAASRAKLLMVCKAFVAFFPRSETSSVPVIDQMVTIWPLDDPQASQAKTDDCEFVLDHYDLVASQLAISDAQKQHVNFEGEGPFLVGWSPSKARGVPDALVLVVDMSADNNQADIDHKFRFWKNKIIEDPSLWRNGWSVEQVRQAIHNFAEEYGQSMLEAIKLFGAGP